MKVRYGFISNSSSTSFIVVLPPFFDAKVVAQSIPKIRRDLAEKYLRKLQDGDHLYEELFYEKDKELVKVYPDVYDDIYGAIKKYVVAEKRSGPDDGEIIPADVTKIRKILGVE